MEEKTKDEVINTLNDLIRTLEEQKTHMERHIFFLQHELRIKEENKPPMSYKYW